MADTLEEALSFLGSGNTGESEVEVLEIDSDLRTIRIPEDFVFGVYNDKNVYDVHFTMPRYYRGIDLSEFNIQVNYMTPVNVGNIYLVESPTVEEESIDFVWILDRGVFLAAGSVQFSVCLRQIGEDGAVLKEFNTTIARANVLSGLEIENIEDPESYSLLAHMKQVEERVERQGDAVFARYSQLQGLILTTASGTATAPGGSITGAVSYHTKGFYTTISTSDIVIPTVSSSGWVDVATLPEGSRPYVTTNTIGIKSNAASPSDMPVQIRISTDGKVQAFLTASMGQVDLYFSIVFLSLY